MTAPTTYVEQVRRQYAHDYAVQRFNWKRSRERKVVQLSPIVDDVDILEMQYGHEVVANYVPIRSLDDDTRNFYPEPDVTTVADHHADTFWRGTSDTRNYKPELQRADVIYAGDVKLYPSFDNYGNRLIRYFDSEATNVTFRLRVMHDQHGEFIRVAMFRNIKRNNRWVGKEMAKYDARNPYADLTEQRCMYWMLAQLNKGFM